MQDVYGVFQFVLDYERPGYTRLHSAIQVLPFQRPAPFPASVSVSVSVSCAIRFRVSCSHLLSRSLSVASYAVGLATTWGTSHYGPIPTRGTQDPTRRNTLNV